MPSPADSVMTLIENNQPTRQDDTPNRFKLIDEKSGDAYPATRRASHAIARPFVENTAPVETTPTQERPISNDNSAEHTIDPTSTRVIDIETAPLNEVDRITQFANTVAAATLNVVELHNAKFPNDQRKGFRYETPPRSGHWHEIQIKETKKIKGDPGRNVYIIEMTPLEPGTDPRQAKKKSEGVLVLKVEDASPKITQVVGRASVNVTGCGIIEEKGRRRQIIRAEEVEEKLLKNAPLPAKPAPVAPQAARPNGQAQPIANPTANPTAINNPTAAPANPTAVPNVAETPEALNARNTPTRAQITEILSRRDIDVTDIDLELLAARGLADQRTMMRLQKEYNNPNVAPARLLPLAQQIYEVRAQMIEVETKRRNVIDALINYDPAQDRLQRGPRTTLPPAQTPPAVPQSVPQATAQNPTANAEPTPTTPPVVQQPRPQKQPTQTTPPIVQAPKPTAPPERLGEPKNIKPEQNATKSKVEQQAILADKKLTAISKRLDVFADKLTNDEFNDIDGYIRQPLPQDPYKVLTALNRQVLVLEYIEARLANREQFNLSVDALVQDALRANPTMAPAEIANLRNLQQRITYAEINTGDFTDFMSEIYRRTRKPKQQQAPQQTTPPAQPTAAKPNGKPNAKPNAPKPNNNSSTSSAPHRPQLINPLTRKPNANTGGPKKPIVIPAPQNKIQDQRDNRPNRPPFRQWDPSAKK